MIDNAITVPTSTPPRWVNSSVALMLRTPGLAHLLGRGIAMITVTGRATGTLYTTPVSYYRDRDAVLVITKRFRKWWRNLDTNPEVDLRLAGRRFRGHAKALLDDPAALARLTTYLEHRRVDARANGFTFTQDGHLDPERARAILPQLVIVEITELHR